MDNTTIILVLFLVIGGYLLTTQQVEGSSAVLLSILLVIVLVIYVMNMSMFQSYTQVLDSATDSTIAATIDGSKYSQKSTEYSVSTWIYISDWSNRNGQEKIIMQRKTNTTGDNPSLVLGSFQNDLIINFQTYDVTTVEPTNNKITIPNISIQKWVNIVVCFGNTNVDTYINGKLVNTFVTNNPQNIQIGAKNQQPASFSITPNGGFSGSISQCRYYDRLLTPQEAWDIYNKGVNGNFLNQYSASFTFYNKQQPTHFWIF
jgi:hypothetical protein